MDYDVSTEGPLAGGVMLCGYLKGPVAPSSVGCLYLHVTPPL